MTRKDETARIERGVRRFLADLGAETIMEFTPERGRRIDLMALTKSGAFWAIEVKSGVEDFRADRKWEGYLDWCDRYFWAVDEAFPSELLPADTGLIMADAYDAKIIRMAPEDKLPAARRTALTRRFARHAARRLQALRDPVL